MLVLSRRDMLKLSLLGAGAAALPTVELLRWAQPASGTVSSPSFTQFNVPLFVPPALVRVDFDDTADYYQVYQEKFTVQNTTGTPTHQGALLPGFSTDIWAYGGKTPQSLSDSDVKFSLPGPTFKVNRFRNVVVEQVNNFGCTGGPQFPPNTAVHFHGGRVRPDSDGDPKDETLPSACTTHGGGLPFPANVCPRTPNTNIHTHYYPNLQPAATLWYHDHDFENTGINVFMGQAGLYVLTDPNEQRLNLPGGATDSDPNFDVPLAILDRAFTTAGQPAGVAALDYAGAKTSQGAFGDVIMANGVAQPYMNVWPRKYRFRILNASNARIYGLQLSQSPQSGPSFTVISSDGGLLPSPQGTNWLLIVEAERWNVVIDFSKFPQPAHGQTTNVVLQNTISGLFGDPIDSSKTNQIMQFRILDGSKVAQNPLWNPTTQQFNADSNTTLPATWDGNDTSTVPGTLADPNDLVRFGMQPCNQVSSEPPVARSFRFDNQGNNNQWTINGLPFDNGRIDALPPQNASEVWEFVNNSGGWLHPIHPHLVEFTVLSRGANGGGHDTTGTQFPVQAWECGALKDVVKLGPNETAHVLIEPVPNDSGGARVVTDGVITSGSATVTSATANFANPADVGVRIASADRVVSDGVTTNGSTTLTSATANFTAADAGRAISGSGIPAGTTIQSVVNSTTVTMSAAATTTASGVTVRIAGPIPVGARIVTVVSATQVTISANATASATGVMLTINGSAVFVTDGVTNGTTTVTSATANFAAADVGARIAGVGIPVGARIVAVNSSSSVTISASATASGTGVILFVSRESGGTRIVTDGTTTSGSPTVTSATANFTAADVGARLVGAGIPTGARIVSVVSATQVTISANATATQFCATLEVNGAITVNDGTTQSGSKTVTSATANFRRDFPFSDVGQAIAGPGIPANSIIFSVDSTTQVTISAPATATATAVRLIVTPAHPTGFHTPDHMTGLVKNAKTVNDGVTTSGSATLTSATASFSAADVGVAVWGNGIPAGATILAVNSSTSVTMSAAATATATGVQVTIGRGDQLIEGCFDPKTADFGGFGAVFDDAVTIAGSQTLTSATANFVASDKGLGIIGAGIPAGVTINNVNSSTSVTLSNSATVTASGVTIVIARPTAKFTDGVTNLGSTTLTSATANFVASDVGKTISGSGIPAYTTIVAVVNSTTVTMCAAATATSPPGGVQITVGRTGFLTPIAPYVMHCHNIEHEDHEMMLRWGVLR